jgi:glycosyltransferase involved in cell wall biosynthesis
MKHQVADKYFFLVGSFKLGGTEKVAMQVGDELNRMGHDVRFVSLVKERDYAIDSDRLLILLDHKPTNLISGFFKAYVALFRLLRTHRPVSIVSFSVGLNLFLFFQFYAKSIFVIDTNFFYFKKKWYYKYLLKLFILFPHITSVVIPSKGLHAACTAFFFKTAKLVLIGNPVDKMKIDQLKDEAIEESYLNNQKFVVSAGRLVEMKGFSGLINVFNDSKIKDHFKLVILGKGRHEEALKRQVKNLKLESTVFFVGFKANPYKYFRQSRLFILNSKFESFGNVLIEALATGVPVLSSDCDFGPRDIIGEHNGKLFKVNDEEDLQRKLEEVLFSEGLYDRLKANALKSVESFRLDLVALEWLKVLK